MLKGQVSGWLWRMHCNLAEQEVAMLYWALIFLVLGLVAAALGFTDIAGAAIGIAKFLAGLFLVLFLIFLVLGITAARKILD